MSRLGAVAKTAFKKVTHCIFDLDGLLLGKIFEKETVNRFRDVCTALCNRKAANFKRCGVAGLSRNSPDLQKVDCACK